MIEKEWKVLLICVLIGGLVIVGLIGWKHIENTKPAYSVKELLMKYPLISDLKRAVNSGELDYSKLPIPAKEALDNYDSYEHESILTRGSP